MTHTKQDLEFKRDATNVFGALAVLAFLVGAYVTSCALAPGCSRWLVTAGAFFVMAGLCLRLARARARECDHIEDCLD